MQVYIDVVFLLNFIKLLVGEARITLSKGYAFGEVTNNWTRICNLPSPQFLHSGL